MIKSPCKQKMVFKILSMITQTNIGLPQDYPLQGDASAGGIYFKTPEQIEKILVDCINPLKGNIPLWIIGVFENKNYSYGDLNTLYKCLLFLRSHNSQDDYIVSVVKDTGCHESMLRNLSGIEKVNESIIQIEKVYAIVISAFILKMSLILIHNEYAIHASLYYQWKALAERHSKNTIGNMSESEFKIYTFKGAFSGFITSLEAWIEYLLSAENKQWASTPLAKDCLEVLFQIRFILNQDLTPSINYMMRCSVLSGNVRSPICDTLAAMMKTTLVPNLRREYKEVV